MYGHLTLLAVAIGGLPVSGTVIAIAGVVLALVVAIGGLLVYRSGGKKGAKTATGTGTNDWQRQPQPGAGGWSPPGTGNDAHQWAPPGQGQQAGNWGGQNNPQQPQQPAWGGPPQNAQMQQQTPSPWGTQQPQASPWNDGQGGIANAGTPQQQPAWGSMQNGQQPGGQWATSGNPGTQPAPANKWDGLGQQGNIGGQGGRAPWDANPAPIAQEPWGQQASAASTQPPWGGPANAAPQPPTDFAGGPGSGPSWNQQGFGNAGQNGQMAQSGQADAWGAPQPQYAPQNANNAMGGFAGALGSVPQAPSWQQPQQGSVGQSGPARQQNLGAPFGNMDGGFGTNDGDKTIMRPAGGLGLVRVEEGKEPGREYKIVKEALSIGRSRESDIFLEDLAVSRLHASVVNLGNGQYALKDEGSANGTKVNGQMVGKFQTFPLQEGDRIQLGQTVLVFARS
ncbi:MAG: hypothetical protein NVS4B11_03950 [Ktedonobacteraceae bacterium]